MRWPMTARERFDANVSVELNAGCHASITTTMIYAHLSPDVRRDAVQLLDTKDPTKEHDE